MFDLLCEVGTTERSSNYHLLSRSLDADPEWEENSN